MILIDSNVLIDIWTRDERWGEWSSRNLAACLQAADAGLMRRGLGLSMAMQFRTGRDFGCDRPQGGTHLGGAEAAPRPEVPSRLPTNAAAPPLILLAHAPQSPPQPGVLLSASDTRPRRTSWPLRYTQRSWKSPQTPPAARNPWPQMPGQREQTVRSGPSGKAAWGSESRHRALPTSRHPRGSTSAGRFQSRPGC